MTSNYYYILMADIVESRSREGSNLMEGFKYMVEETTVQYKPKFISPLTITLGDEFQSIVQSLQDGIDMIFNIEEYRIRKKYNFELRYVINYGKIDTPINTEIAHEMLGKGLTEAREALKNLKHKDQNYMVLLNDKKLADYLNQLFFICHSIISHWSKKDYDIISYFLRERDYKKVAELAGRDVSSAWRKQKTLRMKEYFTLKNLILSMTYESFE